MNRLKMLKFFKSALFAVFFFSFLLIQPKIIAANDSFQTSLKTDYTVYESGNTQVSHQITITNLTPTTFIKQYALKTSSTDLLNIVVTYRDQLLASNVVTSKEGTSVAIDFPDEVVGQGKSRVFKIEYITNDIATIGGSVLEVHIPKINQEAGFDSHSLTVTTPTKFGVPVRTSPLPDSTIPGDDGFVSTYKNAGNNSVSLLFGNQQLYSATIRYHLENPSGNQALAQIALPPDTNHQRVFYQSLDPLPINLKKDVDGNWIATYQVLGNSTTTVNLLATILVTLDHNQTPVQPVLSEHTSSQDFWQTRNQSIREIASNNPTAEQIYRYTVDTLNYTTKEIVGKPERLGAIEALSLPNEAVCQEFTDVFITIARAANIPARRLTGYAYTQNDRLRPLSLEGDVLHAWPEYYDEATQRWRQVDPTWEDTTNGVDYFNQFDLNHIVFAINGTSSTSPYAAGFYKTQEFNTKDVEVTFANELPSITPSFYVEIIPRKVLGISIPGLYQAKLINQSGSAFYNLDLSIVDSQNFGAPQFSTQVSLDAILPFQTQLINFSSVNQSGNSLKKLPATVTIQTQQKESLYENEGITILAAPAYLLQLYRTDRAVVLGVGFAVIALTTGSVLVFRRKKQGSLRR